MFSTTYGRKFFAFSHFSQRMGKVGLAVAAGLPEAVKERDRLAKKMTAKELEEAQKLAREWKPKTWEELKPKDWAELKAKK